jgi:hypothetical protein
MKSRINPITRAIPARYQVIIAIEGLNRTLRGKFLLSIRISIVLVYAGK